MNLYLNVSDAWHSKLSGRKIEKLFKSLKIDEDLCRLKTNIASGINKSLRFIEIEVADETGYGGYPMLKIKEFIQKTILPGNSVELLLTSSADGWEKWEISSDGAREYERVERIAHGDATEDELLGEIGELYKKLDEKFPLSRIGRNSWGKTDVEAMLQQAELPTTQKNMTLAAEILQVYMDYRDLSYEFNTVVDTITASKNKFEKKGRKNAK